jgi:5S rRNA maturation endonuclease (ribonuclease M5)
MLNSIQDTVTQLLPARRKTSASGWTSFNAVCCTHYGESRDNRYRGGITTNRNGGISYHCFNCGFKTGYTPGHALGFKFRNLLKWLGADENTIRRLVIDAVRIRESTTPDFAKEPELIEKITIKARPLPDHAQLLSDRDLDINQYLNNRNIDNDRYKFYSTTETTYHLNKRVIIPFTWEGVIIGYTARAVYDEVKPKYHNSYEPGYVFNVDCQLANAKFVIVAEGPFDAMAIDGVSVLGNSCSQRQADIIDTLGREVIVVPDADRAGAQLIDQAVEYGWTVSFPIWLETCKDINQAVVKYGKLFVLKCILETRETSRLKIELRKRKLYH